MDSTSPVPPAEAQERFWDGWNTAHRAGRLDSYMRRQLATAEHWIRRQSAATAPAIIEIGCGTGWLIGSLAGSLGGRCWGVDISHASIDQARAQFPRVGFYCGDALTFTAPVAADVVVSVDAIAHVPDQAALLARVAELLRPGGRLILMTQNPFVWNRSSYLLPVAEGQYRHWPSLPELRRLLKPAFSIRHVSSIIPGGDQGILRVIHSRAFSGPLNKLIGPERVVRLKERLLLGRDMVIVADRR